MIQVLAMGEVNRGAFLRKRTGPKSWYRSCLVSWTWAISKWGPSGGTGFNFFPVVEEYACPVVYCSGGVDDQAGHGVEHHARGSCSTI